MDLVDFTRYVGALLVTLALLLGFLLAVKRLGPTLGLERLGLARAAGGERRLAVVESLALDPRRRLVLVRADGREHLLLLGATEETVVESREAQGGGPA